MSPPDLAKFPSMRTTFQLDAPPRTVSNEPVNTKAAGKSFSSSGAKAARVKPSLNTPSDCCTDIACECGCYMCLGCACVGPYA